LRAELTEEYAIKMKAKGQVLARLEAEAEAEARVEFEARQAARAKLLPPPEAPLVSSDDPYAEKVERAREAPSLPFRLLVPHILPRSWHAWASRWGE
jgi:hypothetical protein